MQEVITNLDSQLYEEGKVIIEHDEKVESLMLIESGKCSLNSYIESRKGKKKV